MTCEVTKYNINSKIIIIIIIIIIITENSNVLTVLSNIDKIIINSMQIRIIDIIK
jgi:hypothetical protein